MGKRKRLEERDNMSEQEIRAKVTSLKNRVSHKIIFQPTHETCLTQIGGFMSETS